MGGGTPERSAQAGAIVHVPQGTDDDAALLPSLTVRESLSIGVQLRIGSLGGRGSTSLAARVDEALARSGLTARAAAKCGVLSGGEARRLLVALATLTRPAVLLLDEPTSGLSSAGALRIAEQMQEVARSSGTVVIAAVHTPSASAFECFNHVLLLRPAGGGIAFAGPRAAALELTAECSSNTADENPAEAIISTLTPADGQIPPAVTACSSAIREASAQALARAASVGMAQLPSAL